MTITYELAKKLNENGFPKQITLETDGEYIYNIASPPTLSELINACIDKNHDFNFKLEKIKDGYWWTEIRLFGSLLNQTKGDSPEEAVSLLWLEINKQNK